MTVVCLFYIKMMEGFDHIVTTMLYRPVLILPVDYATGVGHSKWGNQLLGGRVGSLSGL